MDPAPIAKLRSELASQVKRPLEVSDKSTQYWFDEESAAYNDIDIKLGDSFVVVVCQGALPSEELICRIWHRYADEVWLVDRAENNIFIVPREGVIRVFEVGETLRSLRLPDVAISVAAVFSIEN
jgi:hypothetical protein